ncbi:MAG: tellurite-like stress resistance cysteine protease StiP [Candidatus Competibacteraceae bacterium]
MSATIAKCCLLEQVPSPRYLTLFELLVDRYAPRLAAEILALARYLAVTRPRQVTVVSLARAGTPVGALLARALRWLG